MLAFSQGEYVPTRKKVAILEGLIGNPTNIVIKKLNGQCIAYLPKSTEIIKMTIQAAETFNKPTSLSAGVNCD